MYDRLIVPIEEGTSLIDLAPARSLARALDAALTLAHVHVLREAPPELEGLTQYRYQRVVETWDRQDQDAEQAEVEWLGGLADAVTEADPDLVVDSRVLHAPIAGGLIESDEAVLVLAPAEDAQLDGLAPALQEILRAGECPVVVYRPSAGLLPIRRVLIALDGSEFSLEILGPSLDLARALGAAVTLVEVVTRRSGLVGLLRPGDRSPETAERALRDAQAEIPDEYGPVETRIIEMGNAAAGIVTAARREEAGLICLATHGRGGLRRLILGSVAESVVRSSEIPVLLFRPRVSAEGTPFDRKRGRREPAG